MSIQINCPHCNRVLNVTEKTYGKVLPCPGCQQRVTVPRPEPLPQRARAESPAWSAVAPSEHAASNAVRPLPAGMPPLPPGMSPLPNDGAPTQSASDPLAFIDAHPAAANHMLRLSGAVQRLNLTDMFLGNEKEQVFSLLPGEERIDELTITHQQLFVVKSGVTRLTLTSQRLLCTATRVFSPVYWLLLVLFPPLIFYYVARLSRNRNVAFPLDSVDSVDKRYRPSVLLFVAMIILGYILASLCGKAVATVFSAPRQQTHNNAPFQFTENAPAGNSFESSPVEAMVTWTIVALLGPVVLAVLLATRIVGIDVRSCNNWFPIRYRSGDQGVSEGKIDAFFKSVHAQIEHVKGSPQMKSRVP